MIAKIFTGKWSSYLSGTIIAFFFVFTLYILDSPAGMTDAYIVMSDYCKESIDAQEINKFPFLDWQTGFLGGIFIGALLAALLGGKWKLRMIPKSSGKGMIASAGITIITGVTGGFLVMLGLQVAGDSFLGQWAGAIQLSTSSWVFFASLLVWGVVFTAIIAAKLAKSTADNDQSEKDKKDK
jgi:heme A synthase